MPVKKLIIYKSRYCTSPKHFPKNDTDLLAGEYNYTCPHCFRVTKFTVREKKKRSTSFRLNDNIYEVDLPESIRNSPFDNDDIPF